MVGACALYGGIRLTNHANDARGGARAYHFAIHDVNWQYLIASKTTRHDPELGEMKFWDIVVDGSPNLKDGAWVYVDLPAQLEEKKKRMYQDRVGFRVFEYGDPGNPHHSLCKSGNTDGVSVEEDWFG